jgi:hypothetical protein
MQAIAAAVTGAGSAHVNVFDLFLLLVNVLSSTLARACLAHRSRCTARLFETEHKISLMQALQQNVYAYVWQ